MAFDKAKFLARFIDEAGEHVKNLNEGLLLLEKKPDDMEKLNALFRSAHTIKGSSRMMKLIALSELAHKLEDVLDAVRKRKIIHSKPLTNLMLESVDALSKMLVRIAAGEEIAEPPPDIFKALEKAAIEGVIEKTVLAEAEQPKPKVSESEEIRKERIEPTASLDVLPPQQNPPVEALPQTGIEKKSEATGKHETSVVSASVPAKQTRPDEKRKKPVETVRIAADKLDELIKLMGEIVSGHSRSKQKSLEIKEMEYSAKKHLELISAIENWDESFEEIRSQLQNSAESLYLNLKRLVAFYREDLNVQSLLIGDLQDRSLKMRMLPLSTIFDSFKLSVRNLASSAGKEVDFIIEGGHTELDKKIIEQIGDSLLHMIRNSIDHGIEKPEIRIQSGKPKTGKIRLSAAYEGGSVAIEISDDGAGIPISKLKEKAVQKGFYDSDGIKSATEFEIINLIFEPGFSTAEIITDLSGRGVGMDVVRKNIIDNLKGSIHIDTKEGRGTSFYIKLPLTMAIVHVLSVQVSGIIFAVPTNFISKIIKVPSSEVIRVTDKKAVRLGERIIPIMNLRDILSLPRDNENEIKSEEKEFLTLIASVGNEEFGLVVDELLQEEDSVIKPLPEHMANIRFVSGCIISGTNEILNVLHIPGIVAEAKEMKSRTQVQKRMTPGSAGKRVLIVDDSVSTREIEKGILESYGYHVSLAGDGVEGFEKAESDQFDLIITDIEMPRMNGFTLTEKLKQHQKYKDTPIILVTSLDKEEDKKRGILVGADAYIVKGSFEQSTLLDTIRSLTG